MTAATGCTPGRRYTPAMDTISRSAFLLLLAALPLLSACGNKGPLVMPQTPVPVEQELPPPATEPAFPADPADPVDPVDPVEPASPPAADADPADV